MISVILPTYERADAVLCSLAGLAAQRKAPAFETVVVDDSAGDEVYTAIIGLPEVSRYIRSSPPRTGRFTAGRARNIGAANARGELLVFIDQDVILAPDALAHYQTAHQRHPDVIILGLYHWLRPIQFTRDDVLKGRFHDIAASGLGQSRTFPPLKVPPDHEPGMQGLDPREKDFYDGIDTLTDDAALGSWSGNIGYPRELYMRLGGFDEAINKHGGEDADLGLTARAHGAKWLMWRSIWGVHRWHDRDQQANAADVQANIEYIDKKHGVGKYADAARHAAMDARDWADWRHYQKSVGGVLMRAMGDGTVYACRDGHRLGLPEPAWVSRLGFAGTEVIEVGASGLDRYEVAGVARD